MNPLATFDVPSTGAAGEVDFNGGFESEAPTGQVDNEQDDRPTVPTTSQQHGAVAPGHGAAGGYDIPFATAGAKPSTPNAPVRPQTGLTDPALGG